MLPKFTEQKHIDKGWSEDQKFCVATADGTRYFLRISPSERYARRKRLFELLQQVDQLGIPMCRPVQFGQCVEGVSILYTWIDGEDLEPILQNLPKQEQYALGWQSGEILRKIHTIPAPPEQEAWDVRFSRKARGKAEKYLECPLKFPGDTKLVDYLENNWQLLKNRPQCFQHGDYHVGNMMLDHGTLQIIDFDRYDYGDPWEEFNRIVWCAQASPAFASGQLDGYFGGTPPMDFFRLLAFYIASNTLGSIYWAIPFGESEIQAMMGQANDVLVWYDGMKTVVPKWYGIPF